MSGLLRVGPSAGASALRCGRRVERLPPPPRGCTRAGKAARHEKLAVVDVCPSSGEEEVPTNVEHDQP